jgi:hypothetical protein
MLHSQISALALVAITVAATGCGSSKNGLTASTGNASDTTITAPTTATTTSPTPTLMVKVASGKHLSRAQWIAKGDAICSHLEAVLETNNSKTAGPLRVLPQAVAYERAAVAELARLVPPATMANDWQQFLSARLQMAEDGAKLAEAPSDAITKSPLTAAIKTIYGRLTTIARRDGFKACATA